MIENSFAITSTFIAYLAIMLAIGYYAYKRTSNATDYFLGDERLDLGLRHYRQVHRT